jgi:cyclophilin family peptidyl-prolyl cis-trans isomerase
MRRPSPVLALSALLALLLVAVAGCGGSGGGASSTAAQTTADTSAASGCTKVAAPAPKGAQRLKAPTLALDPSRTWIVTMTTNCGTFAIKLDVARAPKTSASFASLVRKKFFDDLTFHRIATGFVIQGGDPLGNGTGGPGYRIVETPPKGLHYTHGIVAMAKSGSEPDGTSGSQFFIVTEPDAGLPPQYALLGTVTQGLDVVDRIGALPLQSGASDGPPVDPVVIESARLSG